MNKTKIETADYTWNPITGCDHICFDGDCYAYQMIKRFGGRWGYDSDSGLLWIEPQVSEEKDKLEHIRMTLESWRILRSKDDIVTLSTGAIKQLVDYISSPLPCCSDNTTEVEK